jgi:hypothetical protein
MSTNSFLAICWSWREHLEFCKSFSESVFFCFLALSYTDGVVFLVHIRLSEPIGTRVIWRRELVHYYVICLCC